MDKLFLDVSFSLLCGVFTIFALSFLGFIFGIDINPCYAVIGTIASFAIFNYRLRLSGEFKNYGFLNLIFALIIVCAWLFASTFPDLSYDGTGYHKPSAWALSHGYNPVYDVNSNILLQCYPKFSEIFAANIISLTKNIEAGKMYNHLSLLTAFGYSFYVLSKENFRLNKKPLIKWLFVILLMYNPIGICQFSTYCVDGLLYYCFVAGAFSIIDFYLDDKGSKLPLLIFIMNAVILSNIKLGGVLCLICFACSGLFFIKNVKKLKDFYCTVSITVFLVLISGINPYFTNIKAGHHPVYPLMGREKQKIVEPSMPKSFKDKPPYYKFFYSTFSRVDNITSFSGREPVLKMPFSVKKDEFKHFVYEDVRISGLGVFFSGILILSLIMFCLTRFKTKEDKRCFILAYVMCILPVVLNPENWWARYIPYLWMFIVFVVLEYFINSDKKYQKVLCILMLFLMFVNSFIVNIVNIKPFVEQNMDGFCIMREFITGRKCEDGFYYKD